MRPRGIALALLLAATSCTVAPNPGVPRARMTIEQLAGTIGSRPIGSEAAAKARGFIVSALQADGFTVRVQEATAVNEAAGATARVANVIAVREGREHDAIALVSHYDSVPDGPGAQDDALGVATCLEAAKQLADPGLRHTLFVIVTDGEEIGLMGARAVRQDSDVAARVKTVLNFDGTGGTGPPVLFEAGPGRNDALEAWAASAPSPFGTSLGLEIYKRLPNDTDFTIFRTAGVAGINFAPVGDSYVYHTDRDRPAGVADDTISREIANTVATVRTLDSTSLAHSDERPTFFDVGERRGLVYGARVTWAVGGVAVGLGLVAWILIVRRALSRRGAVGLLLALVRSIVTLAAAVGAMVGVLVALQFAHREPTPWYAAPEWSFGACVAAALVVIWIAGRLRGKPPTGKGAIRPLLVWWTTLPVWIAATAGLLWFAPAASYLPAIPLATFATAAIVSRHPTWIRIASLLTFVVVAVLWTADMVVLLGFLVPVFGWLPVVAPIWIFPAIIAVAGVMFFPPWIAIWGDSAVGKRLTTISGALCALALVGTAIGACLAKPYTDDRPARRFVRYVQDDVRHTAWWDLGGSDSFVAPTSGPSWVATHAPIATSVEIPGMPWRVALRSAVPPVVPTAPATISVASTSEASGGRTMTITIAHATTVTARVVLPKGLAPVTSSLVGAIDRGRWTATALSLAPGSDEVRLTFTGTSAAALKDTVVLIQTTTVPTDAPTSALPTWLPPGPATWQARTVFILPAAPGAS